MYIQRDMYTRLLQNVIYVIIYYGYFMYPKNMYPKNMYPRNPMVYHVKSMF